MDRIRCLPRFEESLTFSLSAETLDYFGLFELATILLSYFALTREYCNTKLSGVSLLENISCSGCNASMQRLFDIIRFASRCLCLYNEVVTAKLGNMNVKGYKIKIDIRILFKRKRYRLLVVYCKRNLSKGSSNLERLFRALKR